MTKPVLDVLLLNVLICNSDYPHWSAIIIYIYIYIYI